MKIAIIIDKALPNGLIANTASILGISLGASNPEIVRESVYDARGKEHAGITSLVVPILSADEESLTEIVRLVQQDPDIALISFNKIAQRSKDYDEYKSKLQKVESTGITYSGIALIGPSRNVSKYTGSLPLLK